MYAKVCVRVCVSVHPTVCAYACAFLISDCVRARSCVSDTPQFRGRNPYFFRENPYQSVDILHLCIDVSRKCSRDSYLDAVMQNNLDIM